jgi:hypothetical protein
MQDWVVAQLNHADGRDEATSEVKVMVNFTEIMCMLE